MQRYCFFLIYANNFTFFCIFFAFFCTFCLQTHSLPSPRLYHPIILAYSLPLPAGCQPLRRALARPIGAPSVADITFGRVSRVCYPRLPTLLPAGIRGAPSPAIVPAAGTLSFPPARALHACFVSAVGRRLLYPIGSPTPPTTSPNSSLSLPLPRLFPRYRLSPPFFRFRVSRVCVFFGSL